MMRGSSRRRLTALSAPVAVTSVVATGLVAGLADSTREHDGLSRLDPVVAAQVLQDRTPVLTSLARAATFAGSEVVVAAVAIVVLAGLLVRRDFLRATFFSVAMAGSAALTVLVKLAVARPRPGGVDRLGPFDTSYSFPSGHTLNSVVLLALVVWLCWPVASVARRGFLLAAAAAMGAAVGASRIYLGYHWFTDVLASALVALAWLCFVWLLYQPAKGVVTSLSRHQERPTAPNPAPG
jgi:membrane-associated phospholipid phosphatase